MSFHFDEGELLLINKPLGWTSFDVVNKVRRALRVKKIGHAGTLDPLATGLLILCTGKFTKRINEYQGLEKEYSGRIKLGETTPSYDLETPVDAVFETAHVTEELIEQKRLLFLGENEQFPPAHSAKWIGGERAYHKARRGEDVVMSHKKVTISSFEISRIEMPFVDFRVVCSSGTYIRSLAYDFGKALGSGAHLVSLCRERIGEHRLKNSWELEKFIDFVKKDSLAIPIGGL